MLDFYRKLADTDIELLFDTHPGLAATTVLVGLIHAVLALSLFS